MIRHTWADEEEPQPRRRRYDPIDERNLTFFEGRFFRRETSRHDPDNTVTPDELGLIHQRRLEAAARRQAEAQRNLALVADVGAALRVLGN